MTSNIISSRGRHSSQVLVCLTRSFLTVYYIQRQLSKALSTDPQSSVVMHICSDVYDYMISLPFPIFFSFFLSWIYMFPRGSEWLPTQSSFFFSLFKSSTFLRRLLCIHARSTRNICKRWKRIACRLFIGSQKNQTISVEKRKKERGAKDNCVGGRPVFGGKSVPNLELYGAETDMDSYTPLCFSIRSLYIL